MVNVHSTPVPVCCYPSYSCWRAVRHITPPHSTGNQTHTAPPHLPQRQPGRNAATLPARYMYPQLHTMEPAAGVHHGAGEHRPGRQRVPTACTARVIAFGDSLTTAHPLGAFGVSATCGMAPLPPCRVSPKCALTVARARDRWRHGGAQQQHRRQGR